MDMRIAWWSLQHYMRPYRIINATQLVGAVENKLMYAQEAIASGSGCRMHEWQCKAYVKFLANPEEMLNTLVEKGHIKRVDPM